MAQHDYISIYQQLLQFVLSTIKQIQVHNIANGFQRSNLMGYGQSIMWRGVGLTKYIMATKLFYFNL